LTRSGISRLIDRLEKARLVSSAPKPQDRRGDLVILRVGPCGAARYLAAVREGRALRTPFDGCGSKNIDDRTRAGSRRPDQIESLANDSFTPAPVASGKITVVANGTVLAALVP
jgi:hypothetical protein